MCQSIRRLDKRGLPPVSPQYGGYQSVALARQHQLKRSRNLVLVELILYKYIVLL